MAPMMGKTPLTLRSVVSAILKEPGERAYLEEDLTKIGCIIGLLSKPWTVKDETRMVRELTIGAPNPVRRDYPSTAGNLGCGEMERSV